jgi:hypothetical protein
MNQGIFGFPTSVAGSIISITEFDASGTYTIPDEATSLEILLVGAGGGGGAGGRSVGTSTISGGGGGGGGGGFVHQLFYKNYYKGIKNLNVTIGSGGGGGSSNFAAVNLNVGNQGNAGQAGGFSRVQNANSNTTTTINDFVLTAPGGNAGNGGTTPVANGPTTGAGSGGSGRNFFIAALPTAMQSGAAGSVSTETGTNGPHVNYVNFRSNQGAGGGSATTTTTSFPGGSIEILAPLAEVSVISINYAGLTYGGLTAGYGGPINSGNVNGKGTDGVELFKLGIGAGSQYFSGFGGAGGGAANTVGAGNGGNGYRGGGGGGGGGVRSATALALTQVPSGAGGRGGNGYCRIIARK